MCMLVISVYGRSFWQMFCGVCVTVGCMRLYVVTKKICEVFSHMLRPPKIVIRLCTDCKVVLLYKRL